MEWTVILTAVGLGLSIIFFLVRANAQAERRMNARIQQSDARTDQLIQELRDQHNGMAREMRDRDERSDARTDRLIAELRAHTEASIKAMEARIDKRFDRIEKRLDRLEQELRDLRAEVHALGERVARIETHLEIGMPTQPQPA